MEKLPVDFYLTGETALSRAYLNHRYSDDLDFFFVNQNPNFEKQVELILKSIKNILSNKLTALSRQSEKDVVDIVFIALNYEFNWVEIIKEASEKDMWINAVGASKILDSFPLNKLDEIIWIAPLKDLNSFEKQLQLLISDLLLGRQNSLFINRRIEL
jgi:hypothetical protein